MLRQLFKLHPTVPDTCHHKQKIRDVSGITRTVGDTTIPGSGRHYSNLTIAHKFRCSTLGKHRILYVWTYYLPIVYCSRLSANRDCGLFHGLSSLYCLYCAHISVLILWKFVAGAARLAVGTVKCKWGQADTGSALATWLLAADAVSSDWNL